MAGSQDRAVPASEATTQLLRHGPVASLSLSFPSKGPAETPPAPGRLRGRAGGRRASEDRPGSNGLSPARLPGKACSGLPAPTPEGQLADTAWPRASSPACLWVTPGARPEAITPPGPSHSWLLFPMTWVHWESQDGQGDSVAQSSGRKEDSAAREERSPGDAPLPDGPQAEARGGRSPRPRVEHRPGPRWGSGEGSTERSVGTRVTGAPEPGWMEGPQEAPPPTGGGSRGESHGGGGPSGCRPRPPRPSAGPGVRAATTAPYLYPGLPVLGWGREARPGTPRSVYI